MHNIFQPILNVDKQMNTQINAYEMLVRDSTGSFPGNDFLKSLTTTTGNKKWITTSRKSLQAALADHPDRLIYINIEPCQLNFLETWDFLTDIQQKYGQQVAVEITERRDLVHSPDYLDSRVARLKQMGFSITIDDVCAGSNTYTFVKHMLPLIDRIKLSLLVFKHEDRETTLDFINAWQKFAHKHHLEFVVEGVSNQQIARYFAGEKRVFQQGYYWGKGTLLNDK